MFDFSYPFCHLLLPNSGEIISDFETIRCRFHRGQFLLRFAVFFLQMEGVGMHVSSDFEPTTLSVGSIAPKTAAQVERSASTGATLAEFVFY